MGCDSHQYIQVFHRLKWKAVFGVRGGTWRIIPVSKWLITMVSNKSPKDRVVGPLPNGLCLAYKWGVILITYYITGMILQVGDGR